MKDCEYEILPFSFDDLRRIDNDRAGELAAHLDRDRHQRDSILSMKALSIHRQGNPIAIGGVKEIYRGRGEAWLILAREMAWSDVRRTYRECRKWLDQWQQTYPRIEALCRWGWGPGRKWLTRLGFQCEGVLRMAGLDGADMGIYARVERAHAHATEPATKEKQRS